MFPQKKDLFPSFHFLFFQALTCFASSLSLSLSAAGQQRLQSFTPQNVGRKYIGLDWVSWAQAFKHAKRPTPKGLHYGPKGLTKAGQCCARFEPSDRVFNGSDLISIINDQESFIAEIRFEPSNTQSDGRYCAQLHSNPSGFRPHPALLFFLRTWVCLMVTEIFKGRLVNFKMMLSESIPKLR